MMKKSRSQLAEFTAGAFARRFDAAPAAVAVAPGRVNLIGEHTDHQGYDVFPCAIEQTVRTAIGAGVAGRLQIHFANHNENFDTQYSDLCISPQPCSSNYALAALFGVLEFYLSKGDISQVGTMVTGRLPTKLSSLLSVRAPTGLRLFIEGEVPEAAGVSSSSALEVSVALALMEVLRIEASTEEAAAFLARAECYVGTASGGMDQASILLSQAGTALRISFDPVKATAHALPPTAAFVVADTGVKAPKAVSAATCYNKRVFELKTACCLLWETLLGSRPLPSMQELTLRRVQEQSGMGIEELLDFARDLLGPRPFSRSRCVAVLQKAGLLEDTLKFVGRAVVQRNSTFEPLRRVQHVLTEAARVDSFAATTSNAALNEEAKLQQMGKLMDLSQESLTLEFDASAPELDDLTATARRQRGCYGARLTGAGWGGCAVALVRSDCAEEFCRNVQQEFFGSERSPTIFIVKPAAGATVLRLDDTTPNTQ